MELSDLPCWADSSQIGASSSFLLDMGLPRPAFIRTGGVRGLPHPAFIFGDDSVRAEAAGKTGLKPTADATSSRVLPRSPARIPASIVPFSSTLLISYLVLWEEKRVRISMILARTRSKIDRRKLRH